MSAGLASLHLDLQMMGGEGRQRKGVILLLLAEPSSGCEEASSWRARNVVEIATKGSQAT